MNTQTPMTVSNFLDELEHTLGLSGVGYIACLEKVKEQQSTISTIAADLGSRLSEIKDLKAQLPDEDEAQYYERECERLSELEAGVWRALWNSEVEDDTKVYLMEAEIIALKKTQDAMSSDNVVMNGMGAHMYEELKKENKLLTKEIKLQKTTHKKITDDMIKLMSVMTPVQDGYQIKEQMEQVLKANEHLKEVMATMTSPIEKQSLNNEIEELTGQIETLKVYISKMQGHP